jgi:hypothetical protein
MQPTNAGLFAALNPNRANCDCRTDDFTGIGDDAIYAEDGITYTRKVCINLVDNTGTWSSSCPDDPLTSLTDKGLKSIRVRVLWDSGPVTLHTDAESLVTR